MNEGCEEDARTGESRASEVSHERFLFRKHGVALYLVNDILSFLLWACDVATAYAQTTPRVRRCLFLRNMRCRNGARANNGAR